MSQPKPDLNGQLKEFLHKNSPKDYFADCLRIQHKGCKDPLCECKTTISRTAPFHVNTHQKKIQDAIDRQRRIGKPVRLIILKPRQTGISTISSANVFHSCRFWGGNSMVVSMDLDSSEHIFSINQRFQHYLPDREKKILRTVASNRKELKYEEPHGGRIVVETAGKTSAGHSFTIRNLLLSEVPRWPDGCDDAIVGLLNAVPYEPDTLIITEGVANGMTGWFYEEWHRANSDYEKVFLPWFEHAEYAMTLPESEPLYTAHLTDEEKKLIARHSLSLEQIEFRRWCTREKCKGDPNTFKEQYPATATEAFLASGNSFFNMEALDAVECVAPNRGYLKITEDHSGHKETIFYPAVNGELRLFKKPQKGHSYVMGADVAEGIEKEGEPADDRLDYSSVDVLDRNTGEQVAHFHSRITPDELARQLATLARYYHNAFIGVENNGGYGAHVHDTLLNHEQYPRHMVFRDPQTKKLGWTTSRANKKTLCSDLDEANRKKELLIVSEESVREMRSFVKKPDGKLMGGNDKKDDRVMSLAIANKMLLMAPPMTSSPENHKEQFKIVNIGFSNPLFGARHTTAKSTSTRII